MDISDFHPTERFSTVADDYDRYRPGYPDQILHILQGFYGLNAACTVADVGAGTGILTGLLLQNKGPVIAVEPNDQMREICIQKLFSDPNFACMKGTAESMDLDDGSIDMITCAQAFHWFNYKKTIPEFRRVLKTNGKIALIWNERKDMNQGLMFHYENLLRLHCEEYEHINHKRISYQILEALFPHAQLNIHKLDNYQDMNLEAFIGRLRSCSYCPKPEHEQYVPLMEGMNRLFKDFHQNDFVRFTYETELYLVQKINEQ